MFCGMNWSQYIEEDLGSRMAQGRALPCEPTLEKLAAHYRVSTRPVRTALKRLKEQGVLGKGRRVVQVELGRQTSRRGGHPKAPTRLKHGRRASVVPPVDYVEVIGRELVTRSLVGREVFVRENAMAERFSVSTTTVREAFHRLAGEGVIEHVPRRGWRLRAFVQKDMDDFAVVREALECLALRLSWTALQSAQGRQAMEGFLSGNTMPGEAAAKLRIDDGFHGWIIEAAQNRYIRDIFARFGRYYRFLFVWEVADQAAAVETVTQHQRILKAILRGDLTSAEGALVEHLRYEHPALKRVMDSMQESAVGAGGLNKPDW